MLSFVPGDVSDYPLMGDAIAQETLVSAAQLLRRYHDATTDFPAIGEQGWQLPSQVPRQVVCHGDFAPYNVVLCGHKAVGIIDFDTAHPGPRVSDVAYAAYRWAPLMHRENPSTFGDIELQCARASRFCAAYGLDVESREQFVSTLITRLQQLVDFMTARAHMGDLSFQRHLDEGHHLLYLRDIEYLRDFAELLKTYL